MKYWRLNWLTSWGNKKSDLPLPLIDTNFPYRKLAMWWTEEDFRKTTRFDRLLFLSLLLANLFIYCTSTSYFLQSTQVTDNSLSKLAFCSMAITSCIVQIAFHLDRKAISKVLIRIDHFNWENLRRRDSIKYRESRNRIFLGILGLMVLLTILVIGIFVAFLLDVLFSEDVYFKNTFSINNPRYWIKAQNIVVAVLFPWFAIFTLVSFLMITEIFVRISFYYRILAEDIRIVLTVEDETKCLDQLKSLFGTFNELER